MVALARYPKRINPGRKFSDEETRIYAAGMAAKKRGELRPATEMPLEMYKIWKMGWNRVGHRPYQFRTLQSMDHNTKVEGVHMVRTEVATLDEALDVIKRKQTAAKMSVARQASGASKNWRNELRLAKAKAPRQAMLSKAAARRKRELAEMEKRQVERIEKAIDMLRFSVGEISSFAKTNYSTNCWPALTPTALINVISILCKMIGRDLPDFSVSRKPVVKDE